MIDCFGFRCRIWVPNQQDNSCGNPLWLCIYNWLPDTWMVYLDRKMQRDEWNGTRNGIFIPLLLKHVVAYKRKIMDCASIQSSSKSLVSRYCASKSTFDSFSNMTSLFFLFFIFNQQWSDSFHSISLSILFYYLIQTWNQNTIYWVSGQWRRSVIKDCMS